ncbi:hypothetical protein BBI01_07625 [Chryseobacterium artocarpi]|uniref:Secretion system C-terminal sorting domain-containing protein n=1 Tax=Chryseobacterium artocarpi TaxID=1414727 RepID=A0A1B8ZK94_9FLAO|nr:choice-of-anchor J domain-containing protein [Chryseobacterium artocarpi]OCA72018.1 hypothetical protein BBI01_07625 [Chryseobacterium artocarpi]
MKKLLLSIVAVLSCTASFVNAQTVIYEETFESVTPPSLPIGMGVDDMDGDGSNWIVDSIDPLIAMGIPYSFSGKIAFSSSYDFLNPDNFLITPNISVPVGEAVTLSFLVGGLKFYEIPGFPVQNSEEHYAVYVISANGVYEGVETPIHEETISPGITFERNFDLSTFAGQTVKIYFRHFNSANQSGLMLDDIKVVQGGSLGTSENNLISELKVFPNPSSDYVYLNSKSKISKVQVFDSIGRKVKVKLIDNKADVRNLPIGNYWFSITIGDKTISKKIIKK